MVPIRPQPVTRSPRENAYYAVFFMAGLPALVYQVAWQRILTLHFGVDIYSTTITVAAFMLGLGLGSLAGGRWADRSPRPALLYATVELVIGIFGLASVTLLSRIGQIFAGQSLGVVLTVSFALLLVPSTLMGVTLPLMCRAVATRSDTIGRYLARLYGVNTLGAAVGALATSYLLMGLFGIDGAVYLAAAVNLSLAAAALVLFRRLDDRSAHRTDARVAAVSVKRPASPALPRSGLLTLSFLSGFIGLGYELAWYRVLGCLLHGTVYVFGTILAAYLVGIAAGSLAAKRSIDRPGAVERFATCQFGIALYSLVLFVVVGKLSWLPGLRHAIAASGYTTFHPSPELFSGTLNVFTLYSLLDIPFWTLLLLGVPTFLMGYAFSNLLRAASRSVESLGRSVGGVYFANILGSTAGTLVVGFVLLHYFGTEATLLALILLGLLPAVLIALRPAAVGRIQSAHRLAGLLAVASLAIVTFPHKGQIVRAIHYADFPQVEVVAQAEDRSGVVLLKVQRDVITFAKELSAVGSYRLYIDGANHGGLPNLDVAVPDEMVRLAMAGHSRPRRVLSIGLGNGNMCVAAANWPAVEELVVVELNSALASVLRHTANGRLLFTSPKLRFIEDDGRRWLQANPHERFDVVMMFPLHAAHAHSGSLYSLEFFELAKRHLRPNGVMFLRSADCFSTARTLATAFPYVVRVGQHAYIAADHELTFDLDALGWSPQRLYDCLEADRAAILARTSQTSLNYDLRPNAEFYLTYPYRDWLSPRNRWAMYKSPARASFVRLAANPTEAKQ